MGGWKFLLAAILLSCVLIEVSSITIGSLFGTTRTELSPAESDEEPLEETKKKGEHHKPPKIPLPAVHKPPKIPLLELPHKHKKPIKHEGIITATKTVFVEVTKKVITHPVCVAVHGVKPPCLPYIPQHHHHHGKDNNEQQDEDYDSESLIEPATSFESIEPTRIVDSISVSEENEGLESAEIPLEEESRSGRYFEVAMPTPTVSLKSTGEINEEPDLNARLVDGLFHKAPVKHYKTKTLWVTKVEKLIDYRVTATLEAKNCIPVDLQIPWCSWPHKVPAPGYIHNHGVYVEGETGIHHVHNSGHNEHNLVGGLTGLFGLHKPNKHSKPFAHHKPSHGHVIAPIVHKPIIAHKPKPHVPVVHKPLIKPVHKPGYIHKDEIKESEPVEEAEATETVEETVEALPAETTVEKEVEVKDE